MPLADAERGTGVEYAAHVVRPVDYMHTTGVLLQYDICPGRCGSPAVCEVGRPAVPTERQPHVDINAQCFAAWS